MRHETNNEREIAARRALIANALSPGDLDSLSDDEILELLCSCGELTDTAKKALAALGSSPFSSRRQREAADVEQESSATSQYSSMYRLGSDAELDPSVREEIDRKRQEILKKIKDQKKDV